MANRYWYGLTSSDWQTAANWSSTPYPTYTSSTVPTLSDDVYFQAGWDRPCTTGGTTSICLSLETEAAWASVINLVVILRCHGNLTIRGAAHLYSTINTNILIQMQGTAGQVNTIYIETPESVKGLYNVPSSMNFSFVGGITHHYQLLSDIYVRNAIGLYGVLDTNGYNVHVCMLQHANINSTGIQGVRSSNTATLNIEGNSIVTSNYIGNYTATSKLKVISSPESKIIMDVSNISNTQASNVTGYAPTSDSNVYSLEVKTGTTVPVMYFGYRSSGSGPIYVGVTSIETLIYDATSKTYLTYVAFNYAAGATWNIKNISIKGNSTYLPQISSMTVGSKVKLLSNDGIIDCDYVSITDSDGTGTTTYNAGTHSVLSNTSGWALSSLPSKNNAIMFGTLF